MSTRYSLSSPTISEPKPGRKKRVSSQLSGLMSLKSRKSSEELQAAGARDARSHLSKAAAWVWHTRGIIGEEAVLPTKRVMGHNIGRLSTDNLQRTGDNRMHTIEEAQEMMRRRPPLTMSRFKVEAMSSSTSTQHCPADHHSSSDRNTIDQASSATPADPSFTHSTFFYDDLELSSLQELLDRKAAADHDDSLKPVNKPFSAIYKLFKRLTAASRSMLHIAPTQTPQSRSSCTNSAVHHVIHHHHHHFYHQLHDLPQHSQLAEVSDHELVMRRRRHSESSYDHPSHAQQLINTASSCDEARNPGLELANSIDVPSSTANADHCRPCRRFSEAAADHDQRVHLKVPETPEILGAGRKLSFMDHSLRPRRHSYCVSAPAPPLH